MKSSWRSPDGGSSVARNTEIELCGAVLCTWWTTGSTPIRSFHTVSEEEFSEVRGYKLPRPAPAQYQSGRGRATFSPPLRSYCCICCENLMQAVATCYGPDFREFLHSTTPFP